MSVPGRDISGTYTVQPCDNAVSYTHLHRITVRGDLEVKPYDFPATGVTAYSVGGTPADCVKVALGCLMTEKPDIVFSGINAGYNLSLIHISPEIILRRCLLRWMMII